MSYDDDMERGGFRLGLAMGLLAREDTSVEAVASAVGIDADDVRDAAAELASWVRPRSPSEAGADPPLLSVVLPVLNEQDTVDALLDVLIPVLQQLGTYEIVFVDDGSTDDSVRLVRERRRADPAVKLVQLSRNFGHQAALTAGIDHASGEAVILMDADLQDPPEVLHELVERWRGGAQVVYAVSAQPEGRAPAPTRVLRLLPTDEADGEHRCPG